MATQHIFAGSTPPSTTPTAIGHHYIDVIAKKSYISVNTTSSADWVATNEAVESVNGYVGAVVLAKGDIGLGNVDNTSDINKPVSTLQAAADAAVQAFSIQRANHTGTQLASTISDFTEAAQDAVNLAFTDTATIDFSYNDFTNTFSADVIPGGVDHNALLNFVANKHIDHSTVSISAGTGLSGGGDITTSRTLSLANTAVVAGSYGSQFVVPSFTVDAQGRLTAASNNSVITASSLGAQPLDSTLTAFAAYNTNGLLTQTAADTFTGRTITGTASNISVADGDGVGGNPTLDLISTAVTPGSYGSASSVGTFTVDAKGRLTAAANSAIAIAASAITSGTLPIARGGTNNGSLAVTAGGTLYTDGSKLVNVGAGTAYQVLTSQGASAPVWSTVATGATVATSETTTSTTYTDLATSGPAATLTTGTSALVTVTGKLSNSNNGNSNFMGFAVSGATTVAASDAQSLLWVTSGGSAGQMSATYLVTGLTAGSNTFTAKYRVTANTGTFVNRSIIVKPI